MFVLSQIMTYFQEECSKYLAQGGVTHDMKLSKMRPDWVTTPTHNEDTLSDAIETTKELTGATPSTPSAGVESRSSATGTASSGPRPMTAQECSDYADQGVIKYLSSRITQLNESMADIQSEDRDIKEWEALAMIIQELELTRCNVPGYVEYSRTDSKTS